MQESFSEFSGHVTPADFSLCMECGKRPGAFEGPSGELLCAPCCKELVANLTGMNRAERRRQIYRPRSNK